MENKKQEPKLKEIPLDGIKCPACQQITPKDVKVCENCGKNLEEVVAYFGCLVSHDLEVNSDKLVAYTKNFLGKRNGGTEVFELSKIKKFKLSKDKSLKLPQVEFFYEGIYKCYVFDITRFDEAKEIFDNLGVLTEDNHIILESEYDAIIFESYGVLDPYEKIRGVVSATYHSKRSGKKLTYNNLLGSGVGLVEDLEDVSRGKLAVTDKRVIFVHKGMLYGEQIEITPYGEINTIHHEKGLIMGSIIIHTSGDNVIFRDISNEYIDILVDFIRQKTSEAKNPTKQLSPLSHERKPMEELKQAKELLDIGAITEDEFNQIKEKCLNMYK